MFSLSILIGIYSYLILALGLLGLLYKPIVIVATILFFFGASAWYRRQIRNWLEPFLLTRSLLVRLAQGVSLYNLAFLLLTLLFLQALVNLVGVLGPEVAFDALWYHLTLPKIYLQEHSIFHISGGLLYYSTMPKLAEMLYIAALSFKDEILAKLIHFSFGILTLIALYQLSRKFFSQTLSIIVIVIFYSNLVVAWESITAYIDLARTFFELMALWGIINFLADNTGKKVWLVESAVMLGLAISTKLLAIGSLIIFMVLIGIRSFISEESKPMLSLHACPASELLRFARPFHLRWLLGRVGHHGDVRHTIIASLLYCSIALLVALPWFVFSFINTGSPVYPFFSKMYAVGFDVNLLSPIHFFRETWNMFHNLADPISPMYLIILPLILWYYKKFRFELKIIGIFSLLSVIVWYFTPRTGGGRFILPYLPAFSVITVVTIEKIKDNSLKNFVIVLIIFTSCISILYRGIANKKYVPVLLGKETKDHFLSTHLNFSFGDFYDIDNFFRTALKSSDRVLIYGGHNLYYVDFPFIHESYVKKGDTFNYVLTQQTELPERFRYLPAGRQGWKLMYTNDTTGVKLYTAGGQKWVY